MFATVRNRRGVIAGVEPYDRALGRAVARMLQLPEIDASELADLFETIGWGNTDEPFHVLAPPAWPVSGTAPSRTVVVDEDARALGLTLDDLRAWQPPLRPRAPRRTRQALV